MTISFSSIKNSSKFQRILLSEIYKKEIKLFLMTVFTSHITVVEFFVGGSDRGDSEHTL